MRDSAIFTTKRLILRDMRGLWHKKMQVQSLPYSIVTAHYNSLYRLDLWTTAGKIKISVGKQVDVRRLDMLITMCVLGE